MILKSETNERADLVQMAKDGRVRYSAEQKRRVLELFEQSGMSGKAFAQQHGIKYPTFAYWRKQQREACETNLHSSSSGGFVIAEIAATTPSVSGVLTLTLPNGSEIKANGESGVELLAQLIRKLS